jgi:hypothetical protein
MTKKLLALSVSIAMIGVVGGASANEIATSAPKNTWLETNKVENPQVSTRVVLTDTQMGEITAGHNARYWHNGWFYLVDYNYAAWRVYGRHLCNYHPSSGC